MPDLTRALPVGANVRLVSPSVLFRERAGTWGQRVQPEPSYACGAPNGVSGDAASSGGLTHARDQEPPSTFAGSVLRTSAASSAMAAATNSAVCVACPTPPLLAANTAPSAAAPVAPPKA